jgi:transcriptional regulator with XRE-family HTH domain
MSTLGNRIRNLRESENIQQNEFAKKIGVSNVVLSRYESGERKPDYETLEKIADYFEVTTDYLLGRTDSKKSDWNSKLPELTAKDEKDIAKKLENILSEMENDSAITFDGEPMDETTRELVRAQIESNLQFAKQMAKKKFTPKKYRNDDSE